MLALSVRQPFAELILRGIKAIEYRTRSTTIVGERFYIYASKVKAKMPIWSHDLSIAAPPQWMIELAEQMKLIEPELLTAGLPTGVIVGSAVIEKVEEVASRQFPVASMNSRLTTHNSQQTTLYKWYLKDVQRSRRLRKPKRHPQPMWFKPFD